MISPDLLSVLMRGIQARHLDWGATAEAAQPEGEEFSSFFRGESDPAAAAAEALPVEILEAGRGEAAAGAEKATGLPPEHEKATGLLPEHEEATGLLPEPEEAGEELGDGSGSVIASSEPVLVPSPRDLQPRGGEISPTEKAGTADGRAASRLGAVHPEASGRADAAGSGRGMVIATEAEQSTESPEGDLRDVVDQLREAPAPAERPAKATSASPAPGLASPGAQGAGGQPPLGDAHAGRALAGGEAEHGWQLGVEPGAATASRDAAGPAAAMPKGSATAVTGQVALAIRTGESDRIEIRLDPPELGRVQIEMRVVEGSLHAVVVAERSEVSELLRRNAELLQRDLEAAGYGSVTLDFAAGHQEGSERRNEAHRAGRALAALDMAPATAALVRSALDGRLDIRL